MSEVKLSSLPQRLKIMASITVDVLPYKALFIADPFIFHKSDRYHLFCEVFVSQEDKRIVHLESLDMLYWVWAADVLAGDDYSFPAVYDLGREDELVIVPQISGTRNIRAYNYCLIKRSTSLHWSVELEEETRDLIFVRNPISGKSYLIYGASHYRRAALLASEVEIELVSGTSAPAVKKPIVVAKRGFFEGVIAKVFPLGRLTFRPAGNPFDVDADGFVLPVQATRSGIYGEMFAFVKIGWDFQIKSTTYISSKDLSPAFERTHHISQIKTANGKIVCFDIIPIGGGNRWELRVAKVAEE